MDIGAVESEFSDDGLFDVGELAEAGLGFAEEGPEGAVGGVDAGELDLVEGEVGVVERFPPGGDEGLEDVVLVVGEAIAVPCVGAGGELGGGVALVPDDAAEAEGDDVFHAGFVEEAGGEGMGVGFGGIGVGVAGEVFGDASGGPLSGSTGFAGVLKGGAEGGVGAEDIGGDEGFGEGAAAGDVDDADGGVLEFPGEGVGEEIGDGGLGEDGFGVEGLPGVFGVVPLGVEIFDVLSGVDLITGGADVPAPIGHADEGEVFGVGLGGTFTHRPVHVGLSGGEPDFADEDVEDSDRRVSGNKQGAGFLAGGERIEVEEPGAVGFRGGCFFLGCESDGDFLPGSFGAEDGDGLSLLEDHLAIKDGGQGGFNLGDSQSELMEEDREE